MQLELIGIGFMVGMLAGYAISSLAAYRRGMAAGLKIGAKQQYNSPGFFPRIWPEEVDPHAAS